MRVFVLLMGMFVVDGGDGDGVLGDGKGVERKRGGREGGGWVLKKNRREFGQRRAFQVHIAKGRTAPRAKLRSIFRV